MKFNIRLLLSKDKRDKNNKYPIIVSSFSSRLNNTIPFPTGLKIAKSYWDKRTRKVSTAYNDFAYLNKQIEHILKEFKDAHLQLLEIEPDFADVIQKVIHNRKTKKEKSKIRLLINAIKNYVLKNKDTQSDNYLRVINSTVGHIQKFRPNVLVTEVNNEFWREFNSFLVGQNLANNTIQSIFKRIKTVIEFTLSPESKKVVINAPEPEKFSITKKELISLANHICEDIIHQLAKDIFVFSCCTGFRISELIALSKDNILNFEYISIPGEKKTKKARLGIPITEISKPIAQKYYFASGAVKLFPTISEQEINRSIKEVAKEVGLTRIVEKMVYSGSKQTLHRDPVWKKISIHIGRHTFTSIMYDHTKDLVFTSNQLGHSNIETTMRYTHLNTDNMEKVREAFTF